MHPVYPHSLPPRPPNFAWPFFFQFLLGIFPREIDDNGYEFSFWWGRGEGEQGVLWPLWKWWITILSGCLLLTFWFKVCITRYQQIKDAKTAKKKHVTKKTRPDQIKRSHKYQLLCRQANNCVLKKNHYISHVKYESFLLHMTMMMRSFDSKAMHAQD